MSYETETAERVAIDASPEARMWIRALARERDMLREALADAMRYFDQVIAETGCQSDGERIAHDKARDALKECE